MSRNNDPIHGDSARNPALNADISHDGRSQEVKKQVSSVWHESDLPLFPWLIQFPQDKPSIISSEGAIGKQFNPDGSIGQIGERVGGPFSSEGAIGSQFDASKGGIAGMVESAVSGPRQNKSK